MKHTKSADLRDKSVEELNVLLEAERASLYKGRRDLVFRQIEDTASLRIRRKNIARIMTVISDKKRSETK